MNQPLHPGQPAQSPQIDDADLEGDQKPDQQALWYDQYKDKSFADLARRMVELRSAMAKAENEHKALKAEFEVINLRVVPQRMLKEEQTSIRITGVGRLSISTDAYCNVLPGQMDNLLEWLKSDPENGALVKETINPSTLKSLIKTMFAQHNEQMGEVDFEQALEGKDPEPSEFTQVQRFVNYTPFYKATVTKT